MTVGAATARAFETIRAREEDVLKAYTPGATPLRPDVARPASAGYTPDPLSIAAPPNAYFITADDRGRLAFTRDGGFQWKNGALLDAAGHPVYGIRAPNAPLAPLRADDVDAALGLTADVQIQPDGAVTFERTTIDPRTGVRETRRESLGQIALARFAPGTKLTQTGASHFTAPPDAPPHVGRPGDGNFETVTPYRRENSSIDLDTGLQRLQEAYMALDALRAAHSAQGHVEKTAMDLLK